jgi:hypothetical protein
VLPCFLYIFSELLLLNTEGYSYCRTLVYEILVTINTALCCLQQIPERRPSMSYVQTILQGGMEPDEIVFPTVNSSILEDSILLEDSALVSGPPSESILSKGR